jgi:hypothetical protein
VIQWINDRRPRTKPGDDEAPASGDDEHHGYEPAH